MLSQLVERLCHPRRQNDSMLHHSDKVRLRLGVVQLNVLPQFCTLRNLPYLTNGSHKPTKQDGRPTKAELPSHEACPVFRIGYARSQARIRDFMQV